MSINVLCYTITTSYVHHSHLKDYKEQVNSDVTIKRGQPHSHNLTIVHCFDEIIHLFSQVMNFFRFIICILNLLVDYFVFSSKRGTSAWDWRVEKTHLILLHSPLTQIAYHKNRMYVIIWVFQLPTRIWKPLLDSSIKINWVYVNNNKKIYIHINTCIVSYLI